MVLFTRLEAGEGSETARKGVPALRSYFESAMENRKSAKSFPIALAVGVLTSIAGVPDCRSSKLVVLPVAQGVSSPVIAVFSALPHCAFLERALRRVSAVFGSALVLRDCAFFGRVSCRVLSSPLCCA